MEHNVKLYNKDRNVCDFIEILHLANAINQDFLISKAMITT